MYNFQTSIRGKERTKKSLKTNEEPQSIKNKTKQTQVQGWKDEINRKQSIGPNINHDNKCKQTKLTKYNVILLY